MIVQDNKFDDILKLDIKTLSEYFNKREIMILLQLEPLTRDVQKILYA